MVLSYELSLSYQGRAEVEGMAGRKLYHIFRRKEKDLGRMEGLLRNEVLSFDHYILEYMSCPLQGHH